MTSSNQPTQEFGSQNCNNHQYSLPDLLATDEDIRPQDLHYMLEQCTELFPVDPNIHLDLPISVPLFRDRLSVDICLVLNNCFIGLFSLLGNKKSADSTSSQQAFNYILKNPTPSPNPIISYVLYINVAFFQIISLCSSNPHLLRTFFCT